MMLLLLPLLLAPPAEVQLRRWFAAYEFVPTDAQVLALGPELGEALSRIALDPSAHPIARARALSLMPLAPGRETESAALRLLDADPPILRRKALRVLRALEIPESHLSALLEP